jgi:hypothetical protein
MVMSVCGTDGVTMMAKTLPSVVLAPSAFDGTNHIHTYRSRFIPEGLAEASQIFLRDAHFLPKLLSYYEYCRCDRW